MEVGAESNGGMLGGDLTVFGGSIRWTGKLSDWADVEACGKTDITFCQCVRVRGSLELAKISQIHQSKVETPLLVVILAKKGHDGGAIGSGSNFRRSWEGR